MFDPDVRETSGRDFSFLKEMWKRNLESEKRKHVVAKLFSPGIRLPCFFKEFSGRENHLYGTGPITDHPIRFEPCYRCEGDSRVKKIIHKTDKDQRKYQSKHTYNLKQFGLDERTIRKDYAPVYELLLNKQSLL